MSDRLISADKLKEALRKSKYLHANTAREIEMANRDVRIVDEQPTAYDVDDTVHKIKDYMISMYEETSGSVFLDVSINVNNIVRGGVK